ncbi:MAG TPA: heavy metal translocating P-type ATPase metal-binding domain-containing protein, partial [Flavobacterium sp.]|nr:heavy metal translocating P-type ATPase metal-binding domain-containing protein [Flavobacterium sp.]
MSSGTCFHCGLLLPADVISFDEKRFCCEGCKTVYELFSASDMSCYYDFAAAPGASPTAASEKYGFLSNAEIASSLLDFQEGETAIVTLRIPHIHCSSCIWILENLSRLDAGVRQSTVNFPKKNVRILFDPNQTTLERLVGLLCRIGYEPYISLENYKGEA